MLDRDIELPRPVGVEAPATRNFEPVGEAGHMVLAQDARCAHVAGEVKGLAAFELGNTKLIWHPTDDTEQMLHNFVGTRWAIDRNRFPPTGVGYLEQDSR